MSRIEIVENPRRRRKRRTYTAKQRAYGFGGGRRRRSRKRAVSAAPRFRRRRRNPGLMTLGNPRRYRRRRNPGFLGGRGGLLGMVDLQTSAYVAAGAVAPKVLLGFVRKWWPALPSTGVTGYAVNVGAVLAVGMGVKMMFKSSARAQQVVAGGIAMLMVEAFNQYAGPALGLSGYYRRPTYLSGYYRKALSGPRPSMNQRVVDIATMAA